MKLPLRLQTAYQVTRASCTLHKDLLCSQEVLAVTRDAVTNGGCLEYMMAQNKDTLLQTQFTCMATETSGTK